MDRYYVSVGSDGTDLVVWGIGLDYDSAREDARQELAECECAHEADDHDVIEVPAALVDDVRKGWVHWPSLRDQHMPGFLTPFEERVEADKARRSKR